MSEHKKIIEFFGSDDKTHWISEISKSDWGAASFLVKLIKEDQVEQVLGEGTKLYILADRDRAAAFLTLSEKDCIDDPSLSPWIGFVYTFPEYRGNRYGGLLIERAVAEAEACGHERIYVCSDAVGLYEKYGFEYLENRVDVWGEDSRIYIRSTATG